MDNIYKAVQLTIDSQNLALSKTPTHIYIANQYVDTNDTPLITAPFIIQKALENGAGVVDIVSSTIGSIYEVRLLCDAEVLISGYFYMPPMNAKFSELELYTSYPPRTPPVVNEFWQQTEQYILEKTNTLLNFVQVFNAVSSMRLSLGYLEELLTTKKSNLVSAINEVYDNTKGVVSLYDKNVEAGAGANGWDDMLIAVSENVNQRQINDGLETVAQLAGIINPRIGQRIDVKSYHAGQGKGGGTFVYDATKASVNDGGIIINGWVRQYFGVIDPYMFGAWGDWDAYNQVGHDDTVAFQKCLDYIANNIQNVRVGGSPSVRLKSGSYRVSSLYVNRGIRGFGFSMFGDGETSQLWFDPTGNGITVEVEYTQYKDVVFNGSLKADSTTTIPYIFKFKHKDKAFDIDATFLNCHVRFYNTFARVAGRGFNFKTGSSTYGGTLCEIALDSDLVAGSGTIYTLNTQEASRHYVFSNSRIDSVANIFKITGTHAAKEYVNGINCSGNEATGLASFITSTDCRVVFPSIQNNEVISGFNGAYPMGVINVPRAIGVRDIGNRWNNRIGDELVSSSSGYATSILTLYRFSDYIDGFKMIGTSVKNLKWAVLLVGTRTEAMDKYVKNVSINDCDFYGFGDTTTTGGFINFADTVDIASKLSNINIINNNIQSNNPKYCYWFNQPMTGLTAFSIRNNKYNALFGSELITFVPQFLVSGAVSADLTLPQKTATYIVDGDYIVCEALVLLSTTLSGGVLTMKLPIPAISANSIMSSSYSGTGMLEYYTGFSFAQPIFIKVNAATQQNVEFFQNGASLNLGSKTSSNILMHMRFKYKFK